MPGPASAERLVSQVTSEKRAEFFETQRAIRVAFRYLIGRWPSESDIRQLLGGHEPEASDLTFIVTSIMSSREYVAKQGASLAFRKLFFFHLPKSGGTSISEAIQAAAAPFAIAPHFANNVNQYLALGGNYDEFKGYDIYLGHLGRDVYESVKSDHEYLINFRHPVERVISLYNYFRDDNRLLSPVDQLSEMNVFCAHAARALSFADFVASEHPYIRTWISDFQFRQLTSTPWLSDASEGSLKDALAFVDGALGIYVCEFRDISTRRLCDTLNIAGVPLSNTSFDKPKSVPRSEIGKDTVHLILALNPRDLKIYQHAVDRLLS